MSYPPPGPSHPPPPGGPPPDVPQDRPPKIGMPDLILALIIFPPLGIPALIFRLRVGSSWRVGDHQGAYDAYYKAEKFKKWSFIAVFINMVLGIALTILMNLGIIVF